MQITKNGPNQAGAVLLVFFALAGGRGIFVLEHLSQVPTGQIWLHLLPPFGGTIFAALWLLFVNPVITVPCAAFVFLGGLWRIHIGFAGVPRESHVSSISIGMFFYPRRDRSRALHSLKT